MAGIENLLLARMETVRSKSTDEPKLSVIIEASSNNSLDKIASNVKTDGAADIKIYGFLNSVAAKIPISRISYYERMPGVEKLWDGIGNVILPPIPDVGIQPELIESVPIIMQHPKYSLPENIPGTDLRIDGSGVKVCIIDSGIDKNHPDLKGQISKIMDFTSERNGIDYIGHGTHVAGIIAGSGKASGGKYRGITPGVLLYIAKVLGNTGQAEKTAILDAIEWAVNEKVDIINISLGSIIPGCDGTCHLCRAVDWAIENGIVVVNSAGNDGPRKGSITCPANSRNSIAIGAVNKFRKVEELSSRGPTIDGRPKPDLVAPGARVRALRAENTTMGSPIDDYYTISSGTSMAAPHASGVAALLLQIYNHYSKIQYGRSLKMEPKELKNFIMQGSMEIQNDANIAGRGLLNVPLCVKYMEDSKMIPKGIVIIKGEDARVKQSEGAVNTGVAFGEILAEMVYGNGDMKVLVQEFSGIANKELGNEMTFIFENIDHEIGRKRAKEILNNMKATDDNVKIGEAIGRLVYTREREEILECLRVLMDSNSDAERLYEMVSRGEFEGAWERYLRELKRGMSGR